MNSNQERALIHAPLVLVQVVMLSCVLTAATYAETSENLFSLSLEDLLNIKIAGATKVDASYLSVPASANVFDRQALDLVHITSLAELLPFIPGIHVAYHDDGLYPSYAVRGRRIGSSGRELLILIDGMRIENWYAGGSMTMPHISLEGMQKVEIIRGAVSQVYGSNAFSGVVNMVTGPNLRNIQVYAAEHNHYQLQANLGSRGETVSQKLFFNLEDRGGENFSVISPTLNETVPINNGHQNWEANYQARMGNWSLHSQASHFVQNSYYSGGLYNPDFSSSEYNFHTLSLRYSKAVTDNFKLNLQTGYRNFEWIANAEVLPAGSLTAISNPASGDPLRIKSNDNADNATWFTADVNYSHRDNSQYLATVEWQNKVKRSFKTFNNFSISHLATNDFPIPYYGNFEHYTEALPEANEQALGIMLQNIRKLGKRNELTLGIRYDNYSLAGERASPRIAWVHLLPHQQSLKFIYSEAYRAPTSNEYFLHNNPLLVGNPNLKSETVKTSEALWVVDRSKYRIQLGYYLNNYENPISQSLEGIRQFENLVDNRGTGFEGNFSAEITDGLLTRINFSRLTEKPDDQFRQPDNLITFALSYRLNKWHFGHDIQYVGEREKPITDSLATMPISSYTLHNTKINYSLTPSSRLSLVINNISDTRYQDSPVANANSLIPRSGRSMGLRWKMSL